MRALGWIAIVWLVASVASADAVAPPPTGCPVGTRGESSHRSR